MGGDDGATGEVQFLRQEKAVQQLGSRQGNGPGAGMLSLGTAEAEREWPGVGFWPSLCCLEDFLPGLGFVKGPPSSPYSSPSFPRPFDLKTCPANKLPTDAVRNKGAGLAAGELRKTKRDVDQCTTPGSSPELLPIRAKGD